MRNKIIFRLLPSLLMATLLLVVGCKKDKGVSYDQHFTGLYFPEDSLNYSFGVTPLSVHDHIFNIPVEMMGSPAGEDRAFIATVVEDSSTARLGNEYDINGELAVMADSIRGYIPLLIHRDALGDQDYSVVFRLEEKNGFTPVSAPYKSIKIVFNNRVERPTWKDWMGNPTWPDYYLGAWNPLTYVKFIELFRGLEQKVPETYQAMVDLYGPDLANVEYGWPYDYSNTMTKYVTIPLYQYFMEQHPELGVVIPRPSDY